MRARTKVGARQGWVEIDEMGKGVGRIGIGVSKERLVSVGRRRAGDGFWSTGTLGKEMGFGSDKGFGKGEESGSVGR